MTRSPGHHGLWLGIINERRSVIERTREELQYKDRVTISIEYMKSGRLMI